MDGDEADMDMVSGVDVHENRLVSLFQYYGAKHSKAAWIAEHMPRFRHFVEVCGGTLAVFFALKPNPRCMYTVSDLYGDIVNYYKVIRDQPQALFRLLKRTPYARQEFLDVREIPKEGISDLERARMWFVGQQMSFGGSRHAWSRGAEAQKSGPPCRQISKWATYLKQIVYFAKRLRGAQIENRDIFEMFDSYDANDALFYIDPPYVPETRGCKNNYKQEQDLDFHKRLVARMLTLKGGWVLSGYDHPVYQPLVDAGCKVVRRTVRITCSSTKKEKGSLYREEVLWIKPCKDFV